MRTPLSFFVAGLPKAQPRAKASHFGKFTRVYDPGTSNDWKMIVRNEAKKAWQASGDSSPWTGPLCVDLTFYFPRPKNHLRSNGELKPAAPRWHTAKPDRDNSDKSVLDALTNLGIWQDDKQVCDGRIRKLYTQTSGFMETIQCCAGCDITIKEATQV
jgi:Holliday junction resolvase RusA-like endonuclease